MRATGRHRRLEWEHRSKLALLAAAVSLLWVGFTTLVVPALIESAYRGEGLPALNAIIEGRERVPSRPLSAGVEHIRLAIHGIRGWCTCRSRS